MFGKLAKEGTAVVVPSNVGDFGSLIAQAMAMYGKLNETPAQSLAAKMLVVGTSTSKLTGLWTEKIETLGKHINDASA